MSDRKRGLADNPLFTKTDANEPAENAGQAEAGMDGAVPAQASAQAAAQESLPAAEPQQEPTHEANNQTESQLEDGGAKSSIDTAPFQSANPEISQAAELSTDRPVDKPVEWSSRQVMNRPTAFYLFEDQSEELDDVVRKLRKEYKVRTDRSALLRAILSAPVLDFHDEANYPELIRRLLSQATERMIG